MRIFDRDGKYNFIDDNNVFVGYDSWTDCCETADFLILEGPDEFASWDDAAPEVDEERLLPYSFDPTYFESPENPDFLEEGGAAQFRLVATGKPDLYLVLYNCQNGYYGHGFEATIGGLPWQEGCL